MKTKILWIITLLPMLITAIFVRFMEDSVPMHYDINGNIDRWGSKYEKFLTPCFIIVVTIFWLLLARYYKKKQKRVLEDKEIKEAQNNEKVIYIVAICSSIMFTIMHCFLLYSSFIEAKGNLKMAAIDINMVVNIVIGIFMIVTGNIMPKAKINGTIGVRTPWSMVNDKCWGLSNRVGGYIMVLSGFLIVILTIIIKGSLSTFVMLGILIAATIIVTAYSYVVYCKYN